MKTTFSRFAILMILLGAGLTRTFAQGVGINQDASSPDPSAGLDINFNDKGLLIPRLTTEQRDNIPNPAEGLTIFNTTTKCFESYVLDAWNILSCPGCQAPASPESISGPSSVCPGDAGVSFSIDAVPGASSYNWTVPDGASIVAGSGSTSVQVDFGSSSGAVTVASVNSCGVSAPATLIVTVNPAAPATPGTIAGITSSCAGTSGNVYSIDPVSNATNYVWTVPSDATVTSGQGSTSVTISFGSESGDVSVTAENSCGTSSASSLSVTLTSGGTGSQNFTSGLQSFVVPSCVLSLTIDAYGAQGGTGPNCSSRVGGLGARQRGTFSVTPGNTLSVLVGGMGGGTYGAGGGGGASYVWDDTANDLLLIVAAGGGGAGCAANGAPGSATTTPTASNNSAAGGSNGVGGAGGTPQSCSASGGGGGWLGSGAAGGTGTCGGGNGTAYGGTNALAGGSGGSGTWGGSGGFGGGGGSCCGSGGGGGGYNGGGGGNNPDFGGGQGSGGGGGSYNIGTNQINSAGVRTGSGEVTISW